MPVQPESRSLYVSRPLTTLSTGFFQSATEYIAEDIFPRVPVGQQGGLYNRYKMDDWFRTVAGVRGPATESAGGGWELDTDNYYADVYAVHKDLDDQTRANADTMFNLDRDATEWVTTNLLLKRDRVFVDTFLKTGVWTTNLTGVAAAPGANEFLQWNLAGATPISDIKSQALTMKEKTGLRPNVLVLGARVVDYLLDHPTILDRIKYSQRGIASTDLLATLFGVDRILVAEAIENIAPKGAAASMAFMVNKTAWLGYAAPRPGLLTPSAGYIFTWTGLLGAGAYGGRISRFRMEHIKSDRVEGEMAFDMKVVAPDLGVFFDAAVA
jgi:hypothetical protein